MLNQIYPLFFFTAGHGHGGGHRRETYILRGRDMEEITNAIDKYDNRGENDQRTVWIKRRWRKGPQVPRPDAEPITNDPYEAQEVVTEKR